MQTNIDPNQWTYICTIHNNPMPTMENKKIPVIPMEGMGTWEPQGTLKDLDWMKIPILGMGSEASNNLLPCKKPKPPIERTGTPNKELTLQTWLLRSHFQQNKIHWKQCHEYYVTYEPTVAQLDQEHRFKPAGSSLGNCKIPIIQWFSFTGHSRHSRFRRSAGEGHEGSFSILCPVRQVIAAWSTC